MGRLDGCLRISTTSESLPSDTSCPVSCSNERFALVPNSLRRADEAMSTSYSNRARYARSQRVLHDHNPRVRANIKMMGSNNTRTQYHEKFENSRSELVTSILGYPAEHDRQQQAKATLVVIEDTSARRHAQVKTPNKAPPPSHVCSLGSALKRPAVKVTSRRGQQPKNRGVGNRTGNLNPTYTGGEKASEPRY
jgi:hypothetical protein